MGDLKRAFIPAATQPGQGKRRFKAVVAAAVISATAYYCTSSPSLDVSDELTRRFRFNVTKPLPASPYAICSPLGPDGQRLSSVHTVDEYNARVECFGVRDGKVVVAGTRDQVEDAFKNDQRFEVVEIPNGTIVVPGLSDSHGHILEYGFSQSIHLGAAKSVQETVSLVAAYVQAHPEYLDDPSLVVEAWGWDHESWVVPKLPTAHDLSSHPLLAPLQIILSSKDGHASWVSQATLDKNVPYPDTIEGGRVVRDAEGRPTGVFTDTAQGLISPAPVTPKITRRRFKKAVHDALEVGLTSLHDAGFAPGSLDFFLREAKKEGGLPIRIYGMSFFNASSIPSDPTAYWGARTPKIHDLAGETRLSVRSVKIFGDGALRTAGAALYEPYTDDPTTRGQMRLSAKVLDEIIPRFLRDGWQVNVHAIGDRANGLVLDAFQTALDQLNLTSFHDGALRPRLEHAQVIAERDVARVGRMGVIASVQPTHVISDMWYGEDRLGPERVKQLYPFKSLLEAGARLTLGSDFPVEDMNPLAGFHAAITRLSVDGKSPHGSGGWFPNQCLSRTEALRGMTINPAYASFTEASLGSLEPGKNADFVVLSRDIMTVPVQEILGTQAMATIIDGRVVYGGIV